MKYEYVYKTPDGVRHAEEMEAPSRDAVFATLRANGIKAIKVVAKDGSKANGEVRVIGVKKRVTFALILVVAVISGICSYFVTRKSIAQQHPAEPDQEKQEAPATEDVALNPVRLQIASPLPRQSILGDRKRIDNVPTNLFNTALETYLSKFAEPGRDFPNIDISSVVSNDLQVIQVLNSPIRYAEDEFSEYIDLKRITAGLKREMRNYMNGRHAAVEYVAELVKRQQIEREYREKAEKKLAEMLKIANGKESAYDFWMKANVQLQSMGIYPLPLPEQLRDFTLSFDLD